MARTNRKDIISHGEIQVIHCMSRCVRRAFLCGTDPLSGNNFAHRRQWIRDRLEFLAGVFAIDVLGYAVMSNHLHVVLRTRPDIVAEWSDVEVARRWCRLFPPRRNADGSRVDPDEHDIEALLNDEKRLAERRTRLSCVSWFMRCTTEVIARRANAEDDCTGHFWDGRFRARVVDDEAALAACLVYVDLNPIRAGLAPTPEASQFTSVRDRITDLSHMRSDRDSAASGQTAEDGPAAGWLAPISETPLSRSEDLEQPVRRASDKGCLPMTLAEYLRLVDCTGRQLRPGGHGRIDASLATILNRLGLSEDTWLATILSVPRRMQRVEIVAASTTLGMPTRTSRTVPHTGHP